MSHHNSDQMRECLSHTNGSSVDHSASGGSKNQHSSNDPGGKGATSGGVMNKKPPTCSETGGEKLATCVDNTEKGDKKSASDEHKEKKFQNSPSYSAFENSRASNQPSQSEPMDTSDASSSGARPKRVIELGPTYPIKKLKKMEDFSNELNQPFPMKGHTILIDVRIMQLYPQF